MSSCKVICKYISCGCNRSANCVTWASDNCVYYGSSNTIAVYNPETLRVVHTAGGHKGEVRSVRCVSGDDRLLISTSSDNTAIIWQMNAEIGPQVKCVLSGHSAPVAVACALKRKEGGLLVATTSNDQDVRIWTVDTESYEAACVQTIKMSPGFCLDVKMSLLPKSDAVILACALDNFKISLQVLEDGQFVKKENLVGHEDWITCLDWVTADDGDLILSSGSQDTYIRLWRISPSVTVPKSVQELKPSEEIQVEEKTFTAVGTIYSMKVESVLLCHSTWIQSVSWILNGSKEFMLLSSSTDGSVCVWGKSKDLDLWKPTRMGILKEDSLGILGCVWSPDAKSILAHSLHGAFHKWDQVASSWQTSFTVGGGHFAPVVDLCWEPNGQYLITCSTDQTTRVHGYWKNLKDKQAVWFEVGRPQVHGYDMTCVAPISSSCFASGADEKVIRIFKTSKQFLSHLKSLCGIELQVEGKMSNVATQQELGLSNLSVADTPDTSQVLLLQSTENVEVPLCEEILWKATLWPEERKLYGHGFELHSLASSHSGRFLASACKARLKDHASIIIWDTQNWTELQQLFCHELTVTQMQFSPDDSHLLAVSRDRRLSLYKRTENDLLPYELLHATTKKDSIHTRVIWSCSWSTDSKFFVSGSREGKVVVWRVEGGVHPIGEQLTLKEAVTALDFLQLPNKSYVIAVGCEDGNIFLYQWSPDGANWIELASLTQNLSHQKTVTRIAFQPYSSSTDLLLASCSEDNSVKFFEILLS